MTGQSAHIMSHHFVSLLPKCNWPHVLQEALDESDQSQHQLEVTFQEQQVN